MLKHVMVLGFAIYFIFLQSALRRVRVDTLWAIAGLLLLMLFSFLGENSRSVITSIVAPILFLKVLFVFSIMRAANLLNHRKLITLVTVIHLVGVALSAALPQYFFDLRNSDGFDPGGRIYGFLLNPNAMAFCSAILACYYLYFRKNLLLVAILVAAIAVSGSRSGILFFSLGAVSLGWVDGSIRGKVMVLVALVVSAAILVSFSDRFAQTIAQITVTLDGDGLYVRAAMMLGVWELALANAPWGSGGGTFGSPLGDPSVAGLGTYASVGIDWLPLVIDGRGIHDSGVGILRITLNDNRSGRPIPRSYAAVNTCKSGWKIIQAKVFLARSTKRRAHSDTAHHLARNTPAGGTGI